MKSVETILKAKKCGDLFENDLDSVKNEYRALAKVYHPDVYKGKGGDTVFANVTMLYEKALKMLEEGVWEATNTVWFTKKENGKKVMCRYLSEKIFELGKFYISRTVIIYVLDQKKYFDNALKQINGLRYADSNMQKEFERYFPKIVDSFETVEGKWCLVFSKSEDVFLLEDLLRQQGGKLAEKHTAWVISRLNNICCYLNSIGLVHNGISLNNCFISPKYHSIMLYGGWWYAVGVGEKMLGTQKCIFDIMPLKDKTNKVASYRTDLESVKLIGKQLLADMSLISKKGTVDTIPAAVKEWLKKGASDNPIEEFKTWNVALDNAWGERKFINLDVKEENIYEEAKS